MTYQPKPGTVVYNVIAHLKTFPPGTQLDSSSIAKAIGVDLSKCKQLHMFCERALEEGLLRRRQIPGLGVVRWWSLPGHPLISPVGERPLREIADDELAIRRLAPEIQPRPGPFLPGVNVGAGARWITPVQIGA